MKLNKVIAIPALALAAGLSLAGCGSVKAPAVAPAVTHTVTAPAAAPKPTTPAPTTAAPVAPAPAKTVYVAPAAPAPAAPAAPVTDVPAGMTNCGGGVYAGADTSCPFAQNVAADYTGGDPFSVYSPVTGQSYTMTCTGPGTYEDVVTCEGGNNAEVAFIN
jgi:hypothetical protein